MQESNATHRGGWQRTNTGYDFTGHPLSARIIHHDPTAGDMTERYTYSYDAWGRPLTVTHRLDNLPAVTLHNYSYDAIGRVAHDQRNGDADLATQYSYNVRSWLTDIKVGGDSSHGTLGETFTEKLYYQNQRPVNQQSTVQWGGNVSAMDWMAGSDGVSRRYDFAYDGLSRLTGAGYADDGAGQSDYSRGYGYDRNGNVTLLATATDTTQVSYTGNHLTDGSSYAYDANGNLTKDLGRGIVQISYNLLNLPSNVAPGLVGGPHGVIYGVDSRDYLYTASGVKLQSKAMLPLSLPGMPDVRERTDYVGNLIYDRTSLQKVLFDGGYVDMSGDSPEYRFFVADHLGGNRLVADASGTILQTNHYDPYGESLPDGAAVDSGNPYKYSGKEYDDKALAYDFGARHFTTSIPRWTTMDPMAEKYYSISPYAYCAGNPMNCIDIDGKDWEISINHETKQIVLSMNIVAQSSSVSSARRGANVWNNQSNKFSYDFETDSGTVSYDIMISINVIQLGSQTGSETGPAIQNTFGVLHDQSAVFYLNNTDAGGVSDGKHSAVKESYSESEIVSAHEIGHLFGVSHSPNTVMSEHVGEYHKPRIEGFQIMEILQRSNVGIGTKPEKEAKAKVLRSTIVGEEPQGFGMGSVNKKEKRD